MQEQKIDVVSMEKQAIAVVNDLERIADQHLRTYPSEIDLVYVFSGPGTYLDRLKPGQKDYQAFMDRDRLRAGVSVLRAITASAKSVNEGVLYSGHDITPQDVENQNKYFMYSGIPVENEVFRRARKTEAILQKLPASKTIIADEVRTPNGIADIAHTGHQYQALFEEVTQPNSPIRDMRNVALIAHIPDFVRHPFYAKRLNEQLQNIGREPLNFWFYGLRPRKGTMNIDGVDKTYEQMHTEGELSRLEPYAKSGSLAQEAVVYST